MCNKKETYIGKTKGDKTKGFKVRINQHISDCKRERIQYVSSRIMYTIVLLRIIA